MSSSTSTDAVTDGTEEEAPTSSVAAEQQKHVASKVSIVITTSAIPLNPSTELIEVLLSGLAKNLEVDEVGDSDSSRGNSVRRIPVYIICDGYELADELDEKGRRKKKASYKKCRISAEAAKNYERFIERLEKEFGRFGSNQKLGEMDSSGDVEQKSSLSSSRSDDVEKPCISSSSSSSLPFDDIRVIRVGKQNLGFAHAVKFALDAYVTTPYVLVAQHDYMLIQPFPLDRVMKLMDEEENGGRGPRLDYIGFDSLTTTDYVEKVERATGETPEVLPWSRFEAVDDGVKEDASSPTSESLTPESAGLSTLSSATSETESSSLAKPESSAVPTPVTVTTTQSPLSPTSATSQAPSPPPIAAEAAAGTAEGCTPPHSHFSFLRLETWYDKTHFCRTSAYRALYERVDFPSHSFIEDVFFNRKLSAAELGFGCFVLQQGIGPVIYHLSGRKLMSQQGTGSQQQAEALLENQAPEGRTEALLDSQAPEGRQVESSSSATSNVERTAIQQNPSSGPDVVALDDENNESTRTDAGGNEKAVNDSYLQSNELYPLPELGAQFGMFRQLPPENLNKKFTGVCFICREKGHSSKMCPLRVQRRNGGS
ncbi:unnamed protein product [Amoebophrya sp. A25]|nr:unnamed protein product [Amoebophrya sp. A25]|eukprot:GSA25T00002833001.1